MSTDMNWWVRGNCRTVDPDVMQPDLTRLDEVAAAKRVCRGCPVKAACLAWADEIKDEYSVLGGRSPLDRAATAKRIKGKQRRPKCARCTKRFYTSRRNQVRCSPCSKRRHKPRTTTSARVLAKAHEIAALRDQGLSYERIGAELGFARTSIQLACAQLGLSPGCGPLVRAQYGLVS